jgi:tripartite-type tricarboxylate transporter receptor subunit TctC
MKRLEGWLTSALNDEAFLARLGQLGLEPSKLSRSDYVKFVGSEISRWSQVIRDAGIQPE